MPGFAAIVGAAKSNEVAVKIVREYQRLVVFRLGKSIGQRGPGLVFLIPFVDRPSWVDLREQYLEVPHQTTITKDNAGISVDFLIYWKVVDPVASVVQVQNFAGASQGIATTTLRAVIGGIVLDESSILKAYDGKTRKALTRFARSIKFRLACTATPAVGRRAASNFARRWALNS